VAQRVYRGLPDDPKTERGKRHAALSPDLASDLEEWRDVCANTGPDALVFPSERGTFCPATIFFDGTFKTSLKGLVLGG
jgi:hypothetical protein